MNELIDRYLDHDLSVDEQTQLAIWIKANPANAERFARAVMLHDRLQNEMNLDLVSADISRRLLHSQKRFHSPSAPHSAQDE